MMMMMTTMMAICPSSSSSMTTTTTTRSSFSERCKSVGDNAAKVVRDDDGVFWWSLRVKEEEKEKRWDLGERDVLKRLGKLKRAVAQNRTKDTVPTAETIGMRFSEVLQSCSSSIYVVVVARVSVFLPFSNSLFSWRRGILLFPIGVVSLTRGVSLFYIMFNDDDDA